MDWSSHAHQLMVHSTTWLLITLFSLGSFSQVLDISSLRVQLRVLHHLHQVWVRHYALSSSYSR
jgi:hypothetical protein